MLFGLLVTICSGVTILCVISLLKATRPGSIAHIPEGRLPISVLKPLCGADDSLEANLKTFFKQRYPSYELIFGVEGDSDPAIEVVRRLRRLYPAVPSRLVIHNGGRGINPKVSNLRAMLEAGSHDVVVISDSNVAVRPDYLARMAGKLQSKSTGMVSSLIAGVGEGTLGSTLENLQLNSQIAGCTAASQALGRTLVVGKSVMFRRSEFERLGGFASIANLLAEDYVMGRMYHEAGFEVRLCGGVVQNVNTRSTFKAFMKRYLRWSLMRFRMKVLTYPLELLSIPLAVALLAPLIGVTGPWPLIWAVALGMGRDAIQWLRLRGPEGLARALPLSPLKDLMMIVIWAAAPFIRYVSWRGNRVRVSAGTRLYTESPMIRPHSGKLDSPPQPVR